MILSFPDEKLVMAEFAGERTSALEFVNPLTEKDRDDIRWYLEVYGTQWTADMDDPKAEGIAGNFRLWGNALFQSAFGNDHAKRLFWQFYDRLGNAGGLMTIDAASPAVLSLPWELLCKDGRHLVHEHPHIAVRRRLTGAGGTGRKFSPASKKTLHLLFVVSRPAGAGFLDPRADARAVMDALDQNAPGRVTVEFLRPATLDNLTNRLKCQGAEHRGKPPVDILHFDGHGVFDTHGAMIRKAVQSDPGAAVRESGTEIKPNTGYLLFEDEKGNEALITAESLGDMLTNQKVSLTILSACQSAAVGMQESKSGEQEQTKAISGVAARLVQAGLPCVIAMSHTVLVETTRRLFGQFYARLGDHMGVGAALDEARQHLYAHPERGQRRRGQEVFTLRLYDWFLPALYQSGADIPLLTAHAETLPDKEEDRSRVPEPPESGFWGRSAELWFTERAFVCGTRRITVTGFGGQGKTALAAECARWFLRSGLFRKCCFVSYFAYQGTDPLSFAVTSLSAALGMNLRDANDAEQALKTVPVLLILDNLESLLDKDEKENRQTALLDAAADWSRAGQSRVLITTRQNLLHHEKFPAAGTREHLYLPLSGLAEQDALDYFAALWELAPMPAKQMETPKRHGLLELFKKVDFHPLSVALLAWQLKTRKVAELGERLETLLAEAPADTRDKNLCVSLHLSLERLPPEARKWLPGLGVFHGGAMEDVLLQVTGLGKVDEEPEVVNARTMLKAFKDGNADAIANIEMFAAKMKISIEDFIAKLEAELSTHQQSELAHGAEESTWPELRRALENSGLIRAERLPGVAGPYLKFHPALAPALWEEVPEQEKNSLSARHRAAYYRLSRKLYDPFNRGTDGSRAVAKNELPNLLFAVKAALEIGDENAVEFVEYVNRFLYIFGLLRDRDDLNHRAEKAAAPGSRDWYLTQSNKAEALYNAGRHSEAETVFRDILKTMGDTPSYEQSLTLLWLGRCMEASGRTHEAVQIYLEDIALSEKLEQDDGVRRQTGVVQNDLANALMDSGDFAGARAAYEAGLKIDIELGDERGAAVSQGQLGTLFMKEGNFAEAEKQYKHALQTFRTLNEPENEAITQHKLGMLYDRARQWDAAETAYRESARLQESLYSSGATETYSNLAVTMQQAGRMAEAETWFRRALKGSRKVGDRAGESRTANNLAILLQNDPSRLTEARHLAEQALATKKTLDPGAATIWNVYTVLAEIAEKQGQTAQAREYRRLSREAQDNYLPNIKRKAEITEEFKEEIEAVVADCEGNREAREAVEGLFDQMQKDGYMLAEPIRKIWAGERNEDKLIQDLDYEDGIIIRAILERVGKT